MRVRTVRRLRNRIKSFRSFKIYVTRDLFGDMSSLPKAVITEETPERALVRYLKRYRRQNGCYCREKSGFAVVETTGGWAKFMVSWGNKNRYYI